MSKIIAVVGATGSQGSSVITHLLNQSGYKLRALTRDPSKPAGQALAAKGVEVVKGDMANASELVAAFTGAHAVFAVTDFWAHMDGAREIADGQRIIDAAKEAKVEHFVWSSLDNVAEISKGKYNHVYHFDGKQKIETYLAKSGLNYTSVLPACYWENFVGQMAPRKDAEGDGYTLTMPLHPDSKIAGFEAKADMGTFVKPVILGGSKFYGKRIYAASEELTITEMIKTWSEVTGKKAKFQEVDGPTYQGILQSAGMPEPVAVEFTEMLLWFRDFGYYGGADIKPSHAIVTDKLVTWREFVEKNKNNFA